ncbi:MAG: restriction endonuclease subunit S [Erythrobacter sp.]|nr:MAG: restriction endonuclease subunit S [Erythrobacter sp.]
MRHVSKKYLEEIELPVDHNIDRSRITKVLESADDIQCARKRICGLADELLRACFLDAFGDPRQVRNSDITLADIAYIARGRFSPRPRNDPRFYGGNYPFIQTGEIANADGYMNEYRQTLNERGIGVSKSFPSGTVFVAIVGATIGATAISAREFWCPDSVIGIVPESEDYPAEFIEYMLRFWRPVFIDRAPETARANINLQTLRPVPIPLGGPDKAVQFANLYRKLHKLKEDLNGLDDTLLASLSQRAFRGEL